MGKQTRKQQSNAEYNRLVAQFAEVLSNEELDELMEECAQAEDQTEALRARWEMLSANDMSDDVAKLLYSARLEVVPKIGQVFVRQKGRSRGEIVNRETGWIIKRTDPRGLVWYAGRPGNWGTYGQAMPFDTPHAAQMSALRYAEQALANQERFDFDVIELKLDVPCAVNLDAIGVQAVTVKLDSAQVTALHCILAAMRKQNMELNHRPIDTPTAVIRWILAEISGKLANYNDAHVPENQNK